MPDYTHFGMDIAIQEKRLQNLLRVFYHNNKMQHRFRKQLFGSEIDFFLDVPKLICLNTNANCLELDLRAWGPMTIRIPGMDPESRQVLFNARVLVSLQLAYQNGSMLFSIDDKGAKLEAFKIDIISGGPFSPLVAALLNTSFFHDLIEGALREQLASMQQLVPPLGIDNLGDITQAINIQFTPSVLDQVLAIGIDLELDGIKTTGDPKSLDTYLDITHDIEIVIHPEVLPIATARIRDEIAKAIVDDGATLDHIALSIYGGGFKLDGKVSKQGGAVTFSIIVKPKLIRPEILIDLGEDEYGEPCWYYQPAKEELWFDVLTFKWDVDRDWWTYLAEVLGGLFSFGIGAFIVEDYINMIRNNAFAKLSSAISSTNKLSSARTQKFTIDEMTPPIGFRWETFDCWSFGVFIDLGIRPYFNKPLHIQDGSLSIEEISTDPPRFKQYLPYDTHPDDPQLRIRWTVRRLDTNEILILDEGQAAQKQEITLMSIIPILLTAPQSTQYMVECRVYRVLGSAVEDLENWSEKFAISDRLDRSHPFVRWHHWVYPPIVQVEADGSQRIIGYNLTRRKSRIHRTDFPGRCKMVSHYSQNSPAPPYSPSGHPVPIPLLPHPEIQYLDDLPFPRADLMLHRAELCDYCFFGGPKKTVPLIP